MGSKLWEEEVGGWVQEGGGGGGVCLFLNAGMNLSLFGRRWRDVQQILALWTDCAEICRLISLHYCALRFEGQADRARTG